MKIFRKFICLLFCAVLPNVSYGQATAVFKQVAKAEAKQAAKTGVKQAVKVEIKQAVKNEIKQAAKEEAKQAVKTEMKQAVKAEIKQGAKAEIKQIVKGETKQAVKAEVRQLGSYEAQKVAKAEMTKTVRSEAETVVSQELREGTATAYKKSLKQDLGKGSFSKFSDNAKTAATRTMIRQKNQYVKAADYEKMMADPKNAEKMSALNLSENTKDANVLRNNMKICMGDSYKYAAEGGNAAHHIVGGGENSATARKVLDKYGININDPRNGILLPTAPEKLLKGTNHNGKHTDDYFDKVNRRLSEAKSKEQCLEILDDIKEELYKGKLALYNDHKANTILNSFNN